MLSDKFLTHYENLDTIQDGNYIDNESNHYQVNKVFLCGFIIVLVITVIALCIALNVTPFYI